MPPATLCNTSTYSRGQKQHHGRHGEGEYQKTGLLQETSDTPPEVMSSDMALAHSCSDAVATGVTQQHMCRRQTTLHEAEYAVFMSLR